jgi:hypothetical protein
MRQDVRVALARHPNYSPITAAIIISHSIAKLEAQCTPPSTSSTLTRDAANLLT